MVSAGHSGLKYGGRFQSFQRFHSFQTFSNQEALWLVGTYQKTIDPWVGQRKVLIRRYEIA